MNTNIFVYPNALSHLIEETRENYSDSENPSYECVKKEGHLLQVKIKDIYERIIRQLEELANEKGYAGYVNATFIPYYSPLLPSGDPMYILIAYPVKLVSDLEKRPE